MNHSISRQLFFTVAVCFLFAYPIEARATRLVNDVSSVRGFNYTPADAQGHSGFWDSYDPATVDRDLELASRLHLNQARVFIPYDAWAANKSAFREHLIAFVRACNQHHIGVMPVLAPGDRIIDQTPLDQSRPLLQDWVVSLVSAIGSEPGLAFWDVANEPDWRGYPEHRRPVESIRRRMDLARWMAEQVHGLDKDTPVTIGCTHVPCMEELSGSVDVLSYHDYSPTAKEIRANIEAAQSVAEKLKKPVFNTEIGCIGRANPYDIALQEYGSANMGWYIWELMITRFWGDVHGVFYGDGTVRDPSIAAAVLGIFRNQSANVVQENPDREGWVTRSVQEGRRWLNDPAPDWRRGIDIAETEANLIEAAQLNSMRELPSRAVDVLRTGTPDPAALRILIGKFISILEPFEKK